MTREEKRTYERIVVLLLALLESRGPGSVLAFAEIRVLLRTLVASLNSSVVRSVRLQMRRQGYSDLEIRNSVSKINVAEVLGSTFLSSIESIAASLLSGLVPTFFAIGRGRIATLTPAERKAVEQKVRSGVIAVVGKDFRIRRFEAQYYADLVSQSATAEAMSEAAKQRAKDIDSDLVMISEQPSTIGDYCDLYRGRVFSISGRSSEFPALSLTPRGGPPFHAWCHHYLIAVSPDSAEVDSARNLSELPAEFVVLGQRGASPSEFQKLWTRDRTLVSV